MFSFLVSLFVWIKKPHLTTWGLKGDRRFGLRSLQLCSAGNLNAVGDLGENGETLPVSGSVVEGPMRRPFFLGGVEGEVGDYSLVCWECFMCFKVFNESSHIFL